MTARARAVLVVDDEPGVCQALRRLLEGEGYTAHVAQSGPVGLELLQRHPIQLVISDKDMPRMGGIEFLGLVRDRHPRVCRVLLTGRPELSGAIEAINQGEIFRFIGKPWEPEALLSTLHFAFETLELQEENRRLAEQSERLLLSVLPRRIAEQMKQGEQTVAQRFESATVLFSDLADFTALAARTEAKALVRLLNDVFSTFDALAQQHGVEKIKTVGDGYLAASGLPEPKADHLRAMAEFALDLPKGLSAVDPTLRMRIGLHTGPVVAGVIGTHKPSYDLWGDTVNTASRMESQGLPGRIHCTREVYQGLCDRYVVEPRGALYVKGKGAMETFFLLGRR